MSAPKKIIVASGNNGKVKEINELFGDLDITFQSMRDYWKASVDIEENGSTFMENAHIKAEWVFNHSLLPALADDSGLMVDALDGAPGIMSARFAGKHGDTAANNGKLLALLEDVPKEKRGAQFVCAMVLRLNNDIILRAEGVCRGTIVHTPCGIEGFGYDPLFVPDGYDSTFAVLSSEVKNRLSHRAKACALIKEQLYEHIR